MASWRGDDGGLRVTVHYTADVVREGETRDLDLDRTHFELRSDGSPDGADAAVVRLESVKRIVLSADPVTSPAPTDLLRKVALHFWDGEVITGLLRGLPERCRCGMKLELLTPDGSLAELHALPYHALKAVFFLRTWDTRAPRVDGAARPSAETGPRHDAPLIELLSEIRGLRGLRHRGQISAVEYERRRSQVLERI